MVAHEIVVELPEGQDVALAPPDLHHHVLGLPLIVVAIVRGLGPRGLCMALVGPLLFMLVLGGRRGVGVVDLEDDA